MKNQHSRWLAVMAICSVACSGLDHRAGETRRMMAGSSPSTAMASFLNARPAPTSFPAATPAVYGAESSSNALTRTAHFQDADVPEGPGPDEPPPETGTDPRDFATKFMPYFRYTELENGVEEHNLSLFGLVAFDANFATTYELPIALDREADLGDEFGPPTNPNQTGSGQATGMGDLNMRFFYKNPDWAIGDMLMMPLAELWFPTATEDFLGSNQFQLAPGFAAVRDMDFWPYSFMALMNFYQVDVFGDGGDVSFYKGRWFFMFPFPTMTYLMPEIQPIYDFEQDEFSLWIGPEIGQILGEGKIIYLKPGWGIDNESDSFDREFSFEFGWRWFF